MSSREGGLPERGGGLLERVLGRGGGFLERGAHKIEGLLEKGLIKEGAHKGRVY